MFQQLPYRGLLLSFAATSLVVVVGVAVYHQVGNFGFLNWDDDFYLYANSTTSAGLTASGWRHAWTPGVPPYYMPLTWLSLMLDVELFGIDAGASHWMNVTFHLASSVLVFILFMRLTHRRLPSLFLALLFVAHPLHVEPVVWIAERKEVLSVFLALVSINLYVAHARRQKDSRLWLIASVLTYLLSLLAKPIWLAMPALLLLLDFWPLKRNRSPVLLLIEKLPWLIVALLVVGINLIYLGPKEGLLQTIDETSASWATVPVTYAVYVLKTFWPARLAMPYTTFAEALPAATVAASTVLLSAITVLAWWQRRRRPWLLFGWAWFIIAAGPIVVSAAGGGVTPVADRWTYFPHIGFFAALSFALFEQSTRLRAVKVAAAATLALAVAVLAHRQTLHWRTAVSWWAHTIEVTGDNDKAWWLGGVELWRLGQHAQGEHWMRTAQRINPAEPFYRHRFGNLLMSVGRSEEAVAEYAHLPANPLSTADSLVSAGVVVMRRVNVEAALPYLRVAASRADPSKPIAVLAHFYLWLVHFAADRQAASNEAFDRMVQLRPGSREQVCAEMELTLRSMASDDPFWRPYLSALIEPCNGLEAGR